jgi:cytochrome c5
MQFMFDVADDGTLSGSASFYPTHVPEKARELVNQKGCLLHFDSLTSEDGRIKGQFLTNRDAAIILRAEDCTVKFFGDILLDEPITGTWLVSYSEGATLALKQAANQPLTPLERGMAVFLNQCSACHGISGEGSPGIPSLNTENVRKRTDEELLEIINNGVFNTTMPAWGAVLTEEDKAGLLVLLHDLRVLW